MRGTLRMPNAMVTASKLRSGNGSASALASMKVDVVAARLGGALAADREHLGIDVAHRDARARAAGLDDAEGDVAGAAGEIEQRERPYRRVGGLTAVTSASFQARCRPPDIRSFIRS